MIQKLLNELSKDVWFRAISILVLIPTIWFFYTWFFTTGVMLGIVAAGVAYAAVGLSIAYSFYWKVGASGYFLLEALYKWTLFLSVPLGYLRVIVGLLFGWPLTMQMFTLVVLISIGYYVLVRTFVIANKQMVNWNRNYNSWAMVIFSFAWTILAPMPVLIWGAIPMLIGAALVWESWLVYKAEQYPEEKLPLVSDLLDEVMDEEEE